MDIYSFGMCALEVRKPQTVVMERGQVRRWKGEMEEGQVRSWGVDSGALSSEVSIGLFWSPADGSAGDSGQWRVLICATGSYQQCHPASRRPITEGKNLLDHSLNRLWNVFGFFFLFTWNMLSSKSKKTERTGKSSEYLNISLGGIYFVFCIHTHR